MMSNNKILTVSYGTFSCTLEGFDDSFDTMKAIAEYFRDLAADDRYFGAEPPQPDAEMLARIAEREVARRVEAHEQDGRILLKAQDVEEVGAPAAVAEAAPEQTPESAPESAVVTPATEASTETSAPLAEAATIEVDPEYEVTSPVLEEHATATAEVAASDAAQTAEDFFAQTDTPSDAEEPISAAVFTNSTSPDDADDTPIVAEDLPGTAQVDSPSFADKLARIRAVVATASDDVELAGYDEDSDAPSALSPQDGLEAAFAESAEASANPVMAEAAQDISDALDVDDAAQLPVAAEAFDHDELDNILKTLEDAAEGAPHSATETDVPENVFAEADPATAVQARVMKVERDSVEAALASEELEKLDEDAPAPSVLLENEDEEKDELQHALVSDANVKKPVAERQSLPDIDEDGEEDVSRLMAEADAQMSEPEGRTRRSAFAHLRAAVAARFADRTMDDEDAEDAASSEAYRSDLAEVVKPRRPESGEHRTERPITGCAAPLKLVAEQRVTEDTDAEGDPIEPRRIATDDAGAADELESKFAEYAKDRGATTLPEVLEAAAAYLSFVEGKTQFSRPQLMSRVREADCGEFSREDGLRSFGQLLRAGKIEKIKGGRFAAAEGIGYKPDRRAVG